MNAQNAKVWFITGSSTGFGRILAEQLLAKGDIVVATARKPEQLQDLVNRYSDRALAIHLGIKVIIVEPGAFRTDFNGRSLVMADTQIAEYEEVIGGFRQWLKDMDGKQPGDPLKAALAMIQAVESENPPLRLALGVDAIGAIEAKLDSMKTELEAWREVGANTAFEGATVGAIGG
jgi:NAD(P)-dependent dehydrogenase (short-subunit alcohol dehydrogenase family)